jgi:hypothetical protein
MRFPFNKPGAPRLVGVVVGLAALIIFLVYLIFWFPEWMVNRYGASGETLSRIDYTKLVDDYRKTVAQIIAGSALLAGLYFTWRTTRSAEDGRITDRFSKAVELLGASNKDGHT